MTSFWIPAALLALAAAAFLVYPLYADRRASGRWSATGLAAAAVTIPVAVLLYNYVTTYEPAGARLPEGITQDEVDMVEQLADRMQENPDDVRGWRMLGRSYMALGQYARARRAFIQAWDRSAVKDNELKLSMAEAMIFTDRSTLEGQAADLIEDVLKSEPKNQKALWYGGLVAMQRGRQDLAVSRWSTLLETNPPPELAAQLRQQIASLTGSAPGTASQASASGADAAEGPTIELDVRLGDSVSLEGLGSQAALFIFARAGAGGPPVAVIRQPVDAVPGKFTLSDANTMLQGRSLGDYDELTLVARISTSGQPTEQSGDYYAQTTYDVGEGGPVELVIDQVVP